MTPRLPLDKEATAIAALWHRSWHDSFGAFAPEELLMSRTVSSFRSRMEADWDSLFVLGPVGAPLGMAIIKDDNLDQLFVDTDNRGTGAGSALLAEAEMRIVAAGFEQAWLLTAPQNVAAIGFYQHCGWVLARRKMIALNSDETSANVEVQYMEKQL